MANLRRLVQNLRREVAELKALARRRRNLQSGPHHMHMHRASIDFAGYMHGGMHHPMMHPKMMHPMMHPKKMMHHPMMHPKKMMHHHPMMHPKMMHPMMHPKVMHPMMKAKSARKAKRVRGSQ
jgi:hypothetical protein